jgi:peptidoglycan/LPS O-acetylase OafA/YrhL
MSNVTNLDPMRGLTHRRDLQGVRALAVLLVVLNHARVSFLPGGYIGVDVFFVLSGYFITGLLLRDGYAAAGSDNARVSLPKFYARRARRILPAACLTLIVVSVAVYVVYDLNHANYLGTKPTLMSALSASLFYANFHFAALSTNYFAQAASSFPSPVQHFWSLSVEEQFYLVWPTLLLVVFLVSRKIAARRADREDAERRTAARVVGGVLVVLCGASLFASVHMTDTDAPAAYFSTFARAWELGAGALLALTLPKFEAIPSKARQVLGWAGLGMIAYAALDYSSTTLFPGIAALLPVGGACLIVIAGVTPVSVSRVLGVEPMTFIGDRSYSFYLWHFPVLIIVWQASGRYASTGVNLLLLTGAFVLASLTYKLYENPIRFARWLRGWRTAVLASVALAGTVAAVLVPVLAVDSALASQNAASARVHTKLLAPAVGQPDPTHIWSAKPIPAVLRAADASLRGAPLPPFTPSVASLASTAESMYDMPNSCMPGFGPGVIPQKVCHLGDLKSKRIVTIVGDSHAQQWISTLVTAAKTLHIQIVPLVKPGCFVFRITKVISGWPCQAWYKWAVAENKQLRPVATLVSWEMANYAVPGSHQKLLLSEVRASMTKLPHAVLIADPPNDGAVQPGNCLSAPGATMRTCTAKMPTWYPSFQKRLQAMASAGHHKVLSTLQWFCARGTCPMVINHVVTTHDGSHMTPLYSTELGRVLGDELGPVLTQLEG